MRAFRNVTGEATSDLALPGCTVGTRARPISFRGAREFLTLSTCAGKSSARNQPLRRSHPTFPRRLTFTLRDYQGNPVQDLVLDHNRILHVVIASKDFSVFSHIHAEDSADHA